MIRDLFFDAPAIRDPFSDGLTITTSSVSTPSAFYAAIDYSSRSRHFREPPSPSG
ncbi:hypothetical protein AB7C87_10305 [Natrarchaeobius sp. A-rgal3]|uniref:hypothetical protein n=1 Tax=Natrarchaeobius versutus TaxID=1679078 RepID=UPI00350FBC40